jgi:hypothetical protein
MKAADLAVQLRWGQFWVSLRAEQWPTANKGDEDAYWSDDWSRRHQGIYK